MAEQREQEGNVEHELQLKMEKLVHAFHDEDDKPELLQREELARLFKILEDMGGAAVSQLPGDKKLQLKELLPKIEDALQRCKPAAAAAAPPPSETSKKKKKKSVMSECNPFKSRSPNQNQQDDSHAHALLPVAVAPLLEETTAILGGGAATAGAPEVHGPFYEWTTSYVDESMIYGWADTATEVANALVAPEEDKVNAEKTTLFRTAGITGIHGSGKTALAHKVFVHDLVKDKFPLRLWVCVGPPDHEDKAGLLYRMLDNLGLDTAKVEDIVNNSNAVKSHASAGGDKAAKEYESKIGVLLFILHVTLSKAAGYLIVFDDIRVYGDWYRNLTLPPPADGEWSDRLAYGLPKSKDHRSAVLVTCRKPDDARKMVRTGRVFRPPPLDTDDGWKLFGREYKQARKERKERKEKELAIKNKVGDGDGEKKEKEKAQEGEEADELYKLLEAMKEEIVGKCLGLPVAIVEAAKGFAELEHEPEEDDSPTPEAKPEAAAAAAAEAKPSGTEVAAADADAVNDKKEEE